MCLQAVVAGFNALDRARALVQLTTNTGSERANEWALIYFCLRAGLHKEALQVSQDCLQNCKGDRLGCRRVARTGQGRVCGPARLLMVTLQTDTPDLGAGACCCPGAPGALSFILPHTQLQLKAASHGHGICCSAWRRCLRHAAEADACCRLVVSDGLWQPASC